MNTIWQDQYQIITLTKELIDRATPHSILFAGEAYIEHPWWRQARKLEDGGNLCADGRSVKVKVVVYRGGIADWCIYHSLDANLDKSDNLDGLDHMSASYEQVARSGSKLHSDKIIRSIVGCDDEVFSMYRH